MRIRKVGETPIPTDTAEIIDGYSTSTTDGYSANYINNNFTGTVDIEYEVPTKTGRRFKVNGVWKDEYIYYKNIGNLPNTASVAYSTDIDKSSITRVTGTGGTAYNSSVGNFMILNGVRPSNNGMAVGVQQTWSNDDKFQFYIETGQDRSGWTGHVWVTYY